MTQLRPAGPDDGAAIAAIYAPIVRDTPISFEVDPPSPEEMVRRIERTLAHHPWLVLDEGGALLGYAYAGRHRARDAYRWSVEVSAYVHEAHRGRGVGGALYAALLEILRIQGFRRAYAGITLPNPASVALHESAGFRHLGIYKRVGYKCGAWHDVGWWDVALSDSDDPPTTPVPFAHAAGSRAVADALASAVSRARCARPTG